jgi:hypothetical protein
MINDKIKKALDRTGAKCIRQEESNGHLLSWYSRADDMVLIQEYPDDHGCEVFISVPGNSVDRTVNELHGAKYLEMQWFVRTVHSYGGGWGKGDQLEEAMKNAHASINEPVHISVVSEDWELDNTFGTLTCKYGKHSKAIRMADFLHWETLMKMAVELCEANGLKSHAIDKLTSQLEDIDLEGEEGLKVPWQPEEEKSE